MRTLLFDTETTALAKNSLIRLEKQPYVIEWYGLTLNDNLEETEHWGSLFAYHKPLPAEIVRITHIADADLVGAPKFFEKAEELRHYIESHDRVVGHNLTFDMDRVDQEMARANMAVEWPSDKICTVEQTEFIKGYRFSLSALHEYLFGETFKDAHRAEADVRAMTRCYIELVKRGDI